MSTTFPGSKGKDIGDSQVKGCLVGDVNIWGINLFVWLVNQDQLRAGCSAGVEPGEIKYVIFPY